MLLLDNHIVLIRVLFMLLNSSASYLEMHYPFYDCQLQNDPIHSVTWKPAQRCTWTTSDPLCIDKNKHITRRECNFFGKFQPPLEDTDCSTKQVASPVDLENCPENYELIDGMFCISYMTNTTYPIECEHDEPAPFEDYKKYISEDYLPVWMPVVRNVSEDYGYGLLFWREFSRYYEIFGTTSEEDDDYFFTDGIKDKNCVIYYNSSYMEAVECSESHTAVCAYRLLTNANSTTSYCDKYVNSSCVQSDYSPHSKCFCLTRGDDAYGVAHLAEFVKPYQNYLYQQLTQEQCYFGLAKVNDRILWNTTKKELSYTMWSEDTDFSDGNNFGFLMNDTGKWSLKAEGPSTSDDCVLYQMDLTEETPEIEIRVDENIEIRFRASPTSAWLQNGDRPYIYCFTDCSDNKVINILQLQWSMNDDEFVASTLPHIKGPGNYWCRGFSHTQNHLIESSKIYIRNSSTSSYVAEYVALLEFDYDPARNPLTQYFTNYNLSYPMKQLLVGSGIIPRIFAVNDLDEDVHKIKVTFHLTSKQFTGTEEEYRLLDEELRGNLTRLENSTLIELLSIDTCYQDFTIIKGLNLTWPETEAKKSSDPVGGYCFSEQKIVRRECEGSFLKGVKWAPIDSCEFFSETNISRELSDNSHNTFERLIEILQDNSNLELIDIYFISEWLRDISQEKSAVNITELIDFLDLLVLIPADILKEADELFATTSNILNTVHEMIETVNSHVWYVGNNVLFYTSIVGYGNNTGIAIQDKNITVLDGDNEHLVQFEYALFWKNLYDPSNVSPDSTVVYLGLIRNNFFNDSVSHLSHITFKGVEEGSFDVVFNVGAEAIISEISCGGWSYENKKWENNEASNITAVVYCSYEAASSPYQYYSLMTANNSNLTAALDRLLNSEEEPNDKLDRLYSLSNFTEEFIPVDVLLTSEILDSQHEQVTNIHTFFKIVNNLMNVNKTVMKFAQTEYQATDKILHSIEEVSISSHKEIDVEDTENMKIITVDLRNDNISGILLNGTELIFCHDEDDLDMILDEENFDIFVKFSDHTRFSVNKTVTTIYFNDVLFNEQKDDKKTSQIIGITASTLLRKFEAVSIYYNTQRTSGDTCGYWNFNSTSSSVWRSIPEVIEDSSIVICVFHQFSHYALLSYNITSHLEDILASNKSMDEKLDDLENETVNANNLSPEDIELIAEIFASFCTENTSNIVKVSSVVNNIMSARRDVMNTAQLEYGATDRLLHYIDEMVIKADDFDPVFNTTLFKVVMITPSSGISGLLLTNCTLTCDVYFIYGKLDAEQVSSMENLNAGVVFDDKLLDQLKDKKIIITMYLDSLLFNSEEARNTTWIFGILLPDFESAFDGPISLFYNVKESNNSCGFWEYKVEDQTVTKKGQWNDNMSSKSSMKNLTVCDFDHVTHFALLLDNDIAKYDKPIYRLLDLITLINCVLSAFGILAILVTACLFEKWRRNTGNKILVNFSISLSLKVVLLYVSEKVYDYDLETDAICTVIGAVLHYALLSEFCWMMIIAILQFKRFVEVLGGRPKYILLKACICGWLFPLVPVGLVLSLAWRSYSQTHVGLCYPTGLALYLAVWLPIIVIFIINLIIFTYIIFNVCHKKTEYRETSSNETLFQWRLALLLFFMLGLTWSFGLLAQIDEGLFIFVYLFCFTASLQGFIMFLFFIVFNKSSRLMYAQGFRYWKNSKNFKL